MMPPCDNRPTDIEGHTANTALAPGDHFYDIHTASARHPPKYNSMIPSRLSSKPLFPRPHRIPDLLRINQTNTGKVSLVSLRLW
jgi:hypothetical protein